MASNKETSIGVKLVADLRKYQSNLQKAQAENKRYARQTKDTFSKLNSTFKNLAATIGITFGVSKLVNFAKESMRLYDIQAKAEQQLLVALKGRQDVQKRLIKQAQELQGKTLFGDEETIKAQALIAAFVKEESQIKRVIPLVQDLATAKGMDLAGAADLVSKTLGSTTNALSRYGIQVEGTVGSTERLESLAKGLNDAFGGQAEAAAQVGIGALTQLQNKWGDVKEAIGETIVKSDEFKESIKLLDEEIERLPGFVDKSMWALDKMRKAGDILTGKALINWIKGFKKTKETTEETTQAQEENVKQTNTQTAVIEKQVTTYGDLIQKISEKNDELKNADITDTTYIRTIYREIDALKKQKKAFEDLAQEQLKRIKIEAPEPMSAKMDFELGSTPDMNTGQLDDMGNRIAATTAKAQEMNAAFAAIASEENQEAIGMLSQQFNQLGGAIGGTAGHFLNLGSTMLELIPQLISQIAGLTSAQVASSQSIAAAKGSEAIASGTAASQSVPFPLNLIALAVTIGSIIAALSKKPPKMASGGLVYGDSLVNVGEYANARVNPEVIAPLDKLQGIMDKRQPAAQTQVFIPETRLKGEDIVISYNRASSRVSKRT